MNANAMVCTANACSSQRCEWNLSGQHVVFGGYGVYNLHLQPS